jgi:hypothetical protein
MAQLNLRCDEATVLQNWMRGYECHAGRTAVPSTSSTSITVHPDTQTWLEIPLSCIRSITPPDEDGLIDMVY